MGTVFDYLDWRGDISFGEVGPCEIDGLILSAICYVDFDGIVPSEFLEKPIALLNAAKTYLRAHKGEKAYMGAILPPAILTLLAKAAKTKRFAGVRLIGYVNNVDEDAETQFCALSYLLDDGSIFVAYRGTDDTLVGWKENFNMSFMDAVPAQISAAEYMNAAGKITVGKIYVGGHSKGGNLAFYATVKCSETVRERIITSYSYDGPGFSQGFIDGDDYKAVRHKLRSLIPQSSVVGLLLEQEDNYEVVKSNEVGLMQHDPFSWEMLGSSLIRLDKITEESRLIDQKFKEILDDMDAKQKEELVKAIYDTLSATSATTLTDINTDKKKLIKAWGGLSEENKAIVTKSIKLLIRESVKKKKS